MKKTLHNKTLEIERVPAGPFLLSIFSGMQISFQQVFAIHGTRHSTLRYASKIMKGGEYSDAYSLLVKSIQKGD